MHAAPRLACAALVLQTLPASHLAHAQTYPTKPIGIDTASSTPEQFSALIRSEIKRFAKVVQAAGIQLD